MAVLGGCVSSRERHLGSGLAGVASRRWIASGSVVIAVVVAMTAAVAARRWIVAGSVVVAVVIAVAALVVAARSAGVTAGAMSRTAGVVASAGATVTGPGINIIIVSRRVPVWPVVRRLDLLPNQVELENRGIAQGIVLVLVVVGNEDLLPHRDEARFGDQEVKNPAGHAPVIGHVLVHGHGDGLAGSGSQILIGAIDGDRSALGFGVNLERAEDVLGTEQPGHQSQASAQEKSRFHVFLLGE